MKKIIDIDINAEDLIQNGIKFVIINDFIYIKSSELDVFLDFCLKRNFCILGIDGVRIYMNQITHDLNYIVDYSKYMNDCDFCLKSIEYSREFLKLIDLKMNICFLNLPLFKKFDFFEGQFKPHFRGTR
nr:hypothetical protein [Wohlfahrtiimonas chitiniclastica]